MAPRRMEGRPMGPDGRRIAFLSSSWHQRNSETYFVTRSVAGAASRVAPVDILTPGSSETVTPDGAFQVFVVGGSQGQWPEPAVARVPEDHRPSHVVMDTPDASMLEYLQHLST